MNIQIKCFVDNSIDSYCYSVRIYNCDGKLIKQGETNPCGVFSFRPPKMGIYKIVVTAGNQLIPYELCKVVLIHPHICNQLSFGFHKREWNRARPVTVYLTDKHYADLPIMKGEMILCHKNM